MERNRQAIAGYNSILEYLPAYWMRREIDGKYIPSKWKMFAEGNYKIRTRSITPEDSAAITERFTDYKKIAENQKRKEQASEVYESMCGFLMNPHAWIRSSGKAATSCIITSRNFPPPKTRRR